MASELTETTCAVSVYARHQWSKPALGGESRVIILPHLVSFDALDFLGEELGKVV